MPLLIQVFKVAFGSSFPPFFPFFPWAPVVVEYALLRQKGMIRNQTKSLSVDHNLSPKPKLAPLVKRKLAHCSTVKGNASPTSMIIFTSN